MKEESSCVFAHGTHGLAQVEEKATLDKLHDNVDKVLNDTARWLDNLTGVAILVHANDASVLHILEDGDLVMHRKDGVVIASEELFLEDFDCGVVFSAEDLA